MTACYIIFFNKQIADGWLIEWVLRTTRASQWTISDCLGVTSKSGLEVCHYNLDAQSFAYILYQFFYKKTAEGWLLEWVLRRTRATQWTISDDLGATSKDGLEICHYNLDAQSFACVLYQFFCKQIADGWLVEWVLRKTRATQWTISDGLGATFKGSLEICPYSLDAQSFACMFHQFN